MRGRIASMTASADYRVREAELSCIKFTADAVMQVLRPSFREKDDD